MSHTPGAFVKKDAAKDRRRSYSQRLYQESVMSAIFFRTAAKKNAVSEAVVYESLEQAIEDDRVDEEHLDGRAAQRSGRPGGKRVVRYGQAGDNRRINWSNLFQESFR